MQQPSAATLNSGSLPPDRQRTAIFDLDGTLTTRDSFLAYLLSFGRRHRRYAALARTPFRLSAYLVKTIRDYRLKQDLIRDFLSGTDVDVVAEHTNWFCEHWLPGHLHPIGMRLLESHRRIGDRVILLSASPDIFVPQLAKTLGIREVVCTRIAVEQGRWTGRIVGSNCKGRVKCEAIQNYLGDVIGPSELFAYGDAKSDQHILQWVRYGAWVRRRKFEPLNAADFAHYP